MMCGIRGVEYFSQIKCRKGRIPVEDLHIELPIFLNVTFADLDETTKVAAGLPTFMQQISSQ